MVARELAAEIMTGSPTSVRLSLSMMEEAQRSADALDALTKSRSVMDELMVTDDALEGMRAFAEKRQPRWRNR